MPDINNNGVSIHYETDGQGPPLVLLHGSFLSLDIWRDYGYVQALRDRHRLILIDARGHGQSGKPHDATAYTIRDRASDIVAVLDDLGIATADFLGYSMGGWLGFGLARHAPHRFRSFILGGAHPFAEDMTAFRAMLPKEPAAFVAMLEPGFGMHFTPALRQRIVTNGLAALAALTTDRDDDSAVLATMRMPCLLIVGTADPRLVQVQTCANAMPNVTLVTLPNCDHVAGLARSDLTLPHVVGFLDGLSAA